MEKTNLKSLLIALSRIVSLSILQSYGRTTSSTGSTTDNIDSLKNIALQFLFQTTPLQVI
jgi:hypothetical protein